MKDVDAVQTYDSLTGVKVPSSGFFLDTGTRHYVRFVAALDYYDIVSEGRDIRYHAQEFLPVGVNVNFVEPLDGNLKVRTYEKGVEDETYACGTGIVASCVAAFVAGHAPSMTMADGRVRYDVRAKKDDLSVDFMPSEVRVAEDVWLTGPAAFVAKIIVDLN
jgi:diaminopimelate epimerase